MSAAELLRTGGTASPLTPGRFLRGSMLEGRNRRPSFWAECSYYFVPYRKWQPTAVSRGRDHTTLTLHSLRHDLGLVSSQSKREMTLRAFIPLDYYSRSCYNNNMLQPCFTMPMATSYMQNAVYRRIMVGACFGS
jgi:hypothetical protein